MTRPERTDPGERRMPFGYDKGIKLKELRTRELQKTRAWCAEKDDERGTDRFRDLINDIDRVLEDRQGFPLGLDDAERDRTHHTQGDDR